jgi:hypothetical protein
MMLHLFEMAAHLLVPGGRLVYLLPSFGLGRSKQQPEAPLKFPSHPLFRLQSCCEQKFASMSRFCICMERLQGS